MAEAGYSCARRCSSVKGRAGARSGAVEVERRAWRIRVDSSPALFDIYILQRLSRRVCMWCRVWGVRRVVTGWGSVRVRRAPYPVPTRPRGGYKNKYNERVCVSVRAARRAGACDRKKGRELSYSDHPRIGTQQNTDNLMLEPLYLCSDAR